MNRLIRPLLLASALFVAGCASTGPAGAQGFFGPANIGQPTVPGNCVKIAAQGGNNIEDAGAACGSGGGGGTPGGANFGTQYRINSTTFGGVGPGTTGTLLHANTGAAPTFAAVALASEVSGLLPGANGGTGVANTGKTITIGANVTTTGAGAPTLAFPASPFTYTFQGSSDTLVGRATTDTFTNKTLDTAGTGNSLKINGTAITAVSGTGAVCLASGSACGSGTVSISSTSANVVVTPNPLTGTGTIGFTNALREDTTTTVTIASGDLTKLVSSNNASTVTVNIPQATGSFAAGAAWNAYNYCAGGNAILTPATSTIGGSATASLGCNQGVSIFANGVGNYSAIMGMPMVAAGGFLGNNGGSTAWPTSLTATQSTAMLNVATTALKGLVPAPVTATGKFLKDDLTWATASGGSGCTTSGSANQVVTDNGSGGCTSNAALTFSSGTLAVGTASSVLGTITQSGNTSGTITLKPQAAAGTWEWDWPTTAGSNGNCLISSGGAGVAMTWGSCGGGSTTYTATFSGNVSGTPGVAGLGLVLATANFTDNNTAGSGTAALFAAHSIASTSFLATNATVTTTHATEFRIAGPPTASTNETFTASSALSIATGDFVMESNAAKIRMYNTGSPGATTREELNIGFAANVATIATTNTGGSARAITITSANGLTLNAASGSQITLQNNASTQFTISGSALNSTSASGAQVSSSAASATVPVFVPNRGSTNTGIGAQASGNWSGIVGGAELFRVQSTGVFMQAGIFGLKGFAIASLPTGVTGAEAYVTDANAACVYGTAPTNGGSTVCKVFYNGSAWVAN